MFIYCYRAVSLYSSTEKPAIKMDTSSEVGIFMSYELLANIAKTLNGYRFNHRVDACYVCWGLSLMLTINPKQRFFNIDLGGVANMNTKT